MSNYKMVLTTKGQEKIAAAQAQNSQLELKQIVIGDGGGSVIPSPTPSSTMVREKYTAPVSEIIVDESSANQVVCKAVVPSEVGDFTIREIGVKDGDGELIAYGNFPETFKPLLASGVQKELALKVVMSVTSLDSINLEVSSDVYATKSYVNSEDNKLKTDITTKADKTYVDTTFVPTSNFVSNVVSSALVKGDVSVDNTTLTKNFAMVTYTGNGTVQDITTGISSVDFTKQNNGSGYWLDRSTFEVKTDAGVVESTGHIEVNISKILLRGRNTNGFNHNIYDGFRGANKVIYPNLTNAEEIRTGFLTAFTSNGFSVGNANAANYNNEPYIVYQTLYTHVKWGVTNHNKKYVEAYNPITKDTMVTYEGSGKDGHQIPNSLKTSLDSVMFKNLDVTHHWFYQSSIGMSAIDGEGLSVNTSNAKGSNTVQNTILNDNFTSIDTLTEYNANNEKHMLYGKAKSETWTILEYQGNGTTRNFIETKDINGVKRKPLRILLKYVDRAASWHMYDVVRSNEKILLLDTSSPEVNDLQLTFEKTGFTLTSTDNNLSGSHLLALIEFDTHENGNASYFKKPSSSSNVTLANGVIHYTHGIGANGYVHALENNLNITVAPAWKEGWNYVYKEKNGSFGVSSFEPRFQKEDFWGEEGSKGLRTTARHISSSSSTGVVSSINKFTGNTAHNDWDAFDKAIQTNSQFVTQGVEESFLIYTLNTPKVLKSFRMSTSYEGQEMSRFPKNYEIIGQNGSTETVLYAGTNSEITTSNTFTPLVEINNTKAYETIKLKVWNNFGSTSNIAIGDLELNFQSPSDYFDSKQGVWSTLR